MSDALATQLQRVERLSGELSAAPSTDVGSALANDAARIKQHCEQLRDELDHQQAREEPPPSADPVQADARAGEPAPDGDDAVRSLAIEMKLAGRSRSEVREYLDTTFGRDDAGRIVEDVFAGEAE